MARPKKPVKSLPKAEERAYNGENETQDSQAIFDEYHALHGIGQVRSDLVELRSIDRSSSRITDKDIAQFITNALIRPFK